MLHSSDHNFYNCKVSYYASVCASSLHRARVSYNRTCHMTKVLQSDMEHTPGGGACRRSSNLCIGDTGHTNFVCDFANDCEVS